MKAGAITADEVSVAGGLYVTGNSSYYLYNGLSYCTMSPFDWYYNNPSAQYARVFKVNSDGQLYYINADSSNGVRPVINLRSDITFKSEGTGLFSSPYVVE